VAALWLNSERLILVTRPPTMVMCLARSGLNAEIVFMAKRVSAPSLRSSTRTKPVAQSAPAIKAREARCASSASRVVIAALPANTTSVAAASSDDLDSAPSGFAAQAAERQV
jgi:hypothetical protein